MIFRALFFGKLLGKNMQDNTQNNTQNDIQNSMQNLLAIMQRLRQECPWDKKQTPQSLTPYAIEEAYEVEQAVRLGNIHEIKEELGDLLLQVIFQSQIYSEQGAFDFNDVVQTLSEKLVRRHPHVYDKAHFEQLDEQQILALWNQIKQQEKQQKWATMDDLQRQKAQSLLNEVQHGSALMQAQSLQKVAAKVGFDFPDFPSTYAKLDEELGELKHAIDEQNTVEIEKEFGDCLFALINVGRHLNVSSEMALLHTVNKFRHRFAIIEQQAQLQGKNLDDLNLEQMDQLWDYAKSLE